jgi:hypothetical protein
MKKNGTRAQVLRESGELTLLNTLSWAQGRSFACRMPAAFIGLSAIKWREPAYHVAVAIIHIYSRYNWMPIDEHSCLVAIPTPLIGKSYQLGVHVGPTRGQHPIGNDQALPPQCYWEETRIIHAPHKEDLVGESTDNAVRAVEEWVSRQTRA